MKTTASLSLALFLIAGTATQTALAEGEGPAREPAAAAKAIEVAEHGTVRKVRGVCHLIHGEEVRPSIRIGELLEPGDILDLGTNCALTVAIADHKTVRLDAQHGRYFRIEKG